VRPPRLKFPLFVKSVIEEGSVGIAQASVVHDDEKLKERVEFIHRTTDSHAIAEQYIEGREIYVGVIGNQRLQTYTPVGTRHQEPA
jgi:D-alanine-D-alanine ligase